MQKWRSPLRYPGGKIKLLEFMKQLLDTNGINGTYIECFAGGAGIAINLLLNKIVKKIVINDLDIAIYSFWNSLTKQNDEFLKLFDSTSVNIEEWHNQKEIFDKLSTKNILDSKEELLLGFATYYLNRTNFSGILRGATPIGGLQQRGKWKIDCQFNKEKLRPLLVEIGRFKKNIEVKNLDMITEFTKLVSKKEYLNNTLIFIDPPYIKEGKRLYIPFKNKLDHEILSSEIIKNRQNWVLTYDYNDQILKMYHTLKHKYTYELNYYVKNKRIEKEFLGLSHNLILPKNSKLKNLNIINSSFH